MESRHRSSGRQCGALELLGEARRDPGMEAHQFLLGRSGETVLLADQCGQAATRSGSSCPSPLVQPASTQVERLVRPSF